MGFSRLEYPYSGGDQLFPANFALGYLSQSDITAYVVGEFDGLGTQVLRAYTWEGGSIRLTDPLPNPCVVFVDRTVNKDALILDVSGTSAFTRETLVRGFQQLMMTVHELLDGRVDEFTDIVLIKSLVVDARAAVDEVTVVQAQSVALLEYFEDSYLGALAADPSLDNSGNALIVGAMYFDTVLGAVKVWDGAAWRNFVAEAKAHADAALVSKNAAATSASNAASSASSASTDAGTATTQAGISTTKASEASTSAASALASKDASAASAAASAGSASAAAASETASAGSATTAAADAVTATEQAGIATNAAGNLQGIAELAEFGMITKTGTTAIAARSLAVSGIATVVNPSGTEGNPTVGVPAATSLEARQGGSWTKAMTPGAAAARTSAIAVSGGDQSDMNTSEQVRLSLTFAPAASKGIFQCTGNGSNASATGNEMVLVLKLVDLSNGVLVASSQSACYTPANIGQGGFCAVHLAYNGLSTDGREYSLQLHARKTINAGPFYPQRLSLTGVTL